MDAKIPYIHLSQLSLRRWNVQIWKGFQSLLDPKLMAVLFCLLLALLWDICPHPYVRGVGTQIFKFHLIVFVSVHVGEYT